MTDPVNVKELQAQLEAVVAENRSLKKSKEKFGLTFKRHAEQGEAQYLRQGKIPFLVKDDDLSVIKDTPQDSDHLLIEGDNLSALVMMQATHKGKVDVIYIDPPYNTGNNDFVYNDKFVSNDDGFRHSKWLSFMERRLVLAKELLSETGVIFVSIDDNEQAALKMLMDSVFGEQNFLENFVFMSNTKGRYTNYTSHTHEYIIAYRKTINLVTFGQLKLSTNEVKKQYHKSDEKGLFEPLEWRKRGAASRRVDSPNCYYPIFILQDGSLSLTNEDDSAPILPVLSDGAEGRWRGTRDTFASRLGRMYAQQKRNGEFNVYEKKRYCKNTSGKSIKSMLFDPSYATENGSLTLRSVLGNGKFDYPKSTHLLSALLQLHPNPNAIILDFFAGSGTTGHAVAQLNAEDGGNRQCILVTNNFEEDGSPNGIARDVTAARMKAVLTGKWADGKERDPLPGNLHYYQIQFRDRSDEFEEAAAWGNGEYAGLAALTYNAHNVANSAINPTDDLADYIGQGVATVLHSNDEAVLVWAGWEDLMPEDEEEEEKLRSAVSEFISYAQGKGLAPKFLVCSEGDAGDSVPGSYFFEDAPVEAFPQPYLNRIQVTVKPLVSQGMLAEFVEDEEVAPE